MHLILHDFKVSIHVAVEEFEPLTQLRISYDQQNELENGQNVKPEQSQVAPRVWFDAPNKEAEYTLAMVSMTSKSNHFLSCTHLSFFFFNYKGQFRLYCSTCSSLDRH